MNTVNSPLTLPCDYLRLVPATATTPLHKFPTSRKATIRSVNVCLHARSPVRLHGITQPHWADFHETIFWKSRENSSMVKI